MSSLFYIQVNSNTPSMFAGLLNNNYKLPNIAHYNHIYGKILSSYYSYTWKRHSSYLVRLLWIFWYLSHSLFHVIFFLCPSVEFIFRPSFMLPEISNSSEPGWQPDWKEHDIAAELSAVLWKRPPLPCLYQNLELSTQHANCTYLLEDITQNQKTFDHYLPNLSLPI